MRVDANAYLLEHKISCSNFFLKLCLVPRAIQAYFRREELNSPSPKNPSAMVLTNSFVLVDVMAPRSAVMLKKIIEVDDGMKIWVWLMSVLPGPHDGCQFYLLKGRMRENPPFVQAI